MQCFALFRGRKGKKTQINLETQRFGWETKSNDEKNVVTGEQIARQSETLSQWINTYTQATANCKDWQRTLHPFEAAEKQRHAAKKI